MEEDPREPWLSALGRMAFGPGHTGVDPSDPWTDPAMSWSPPPPEELHRLLPQYEIISLIGRGGMGAVYQARQGHLDRDVAIKLLPEGLARKEEGPLYEARFEQEARAMARLDHSAIVPVYDFGRTERGELYFVMQHVDGTDLGCHLKLRGGRMPQAEALAIVLQVLDGLEYAHGQGIVHRDIKPGNVLINREGRAKLADFGLAKRFDDAAQPSEAALTMSRVTVGTPDFVAPEVLEGAGTPDHRVDLYAVGVMLYQLLTGKVPRGAFEPPSGLVPGIDPRLDGIVARAMAANPDRRHGSAAELRGELSALTGGGGDNDGMKSGSSSESIGLGPERRRPLLRLAAAVLSALVLAGAGASAWLVRNPDLGGAGDGQAVVGGDFLPAAGRKSPFVNSLGMTFVPVPGTDVLFCIHETRWRDYAAFAEENSDVNGYWRNQDLDGFTLNERKEDHPACNVSWGDAIRFCDWLSQKEGKRYRLPTDEEWSLAAGLGTREVRLRNDTPETLNLKIQGVFPWGTEWPPPPRSGNYHDRSSVIAGIPGGGVDKLTSSLKDYDDGYPTTAPVMSFAPNEFGLFDLGGNVWEFIGEWYNDDRQHRAKRGGSWVDSTNYVLLSSHRFRQGAEERYRANGFRVVLELSPEKP